MLHVLSSWCFLNLLVFFLLLCVFLHKLHTLSSLGHWYACYFGSLWKCVLFVDMLCDALSFIFNRILLKKIIIIIIHETYYGLTEPHKSWWSLPITKPIYEKWRPSLQHTRTDQQGLSQLWMITAAWANAPLSYKRLWRRRTTTIIIMYILRLTSYSLWLQWLRLNIFF